MIPAVAAPAAPIIVYLTSAIARSISQVTDISYSGSFPPGTKGASRSNIGHVDNEIDMAGLAQLPGVKRTVIKPQVVEWTFADGRHWPRRRGHWADGDGALAWAWTGSG